MRWRARGRGGLGQCWTMGRCDVVEACVALGLETGCHCDCGRGEQVIVVWDCDIIG